MAGEERGVKQGLLEVEHLAVFLGDLQLKQGAAELLPPEPGADCQTEDGLAHAQQLAGLEPGEALGRLPQVKLAGLPFQLVALQKSSFHIGRHGDEVEGRAELEEDVRGQSAHRRSIGADSVLKLGVLVPGDDDASFGLQGNIVLRRANRAILVPIQNSSVHDIFPALGAGHLQTLREAQDVHGLPHEELVPLLLESAAVLGAVDLRDAGVGNFLFQSLASRPGGHRALGEESLLQVVHGVPKVAPSLTRGVAGDGPEGAVGRAARHVLERLGGLFFRVDLPRLGLEVLSPSLELCVANRLVALNRGRQVNGVTWCLLGAVPPLEGLTEVLVAVYIPARGRQISGLRAGASVVLEVCVAAVQLALQVHEILVHGHFVQTRRPELLVLREARLLGCNQHGLASSVDPYVGVLHPDHNPWALPDAPAVRVIDEAPPVDVGAGSPIPAVRTSPGQGCSAQSLACLHPDEGRASFRANLHPSRYGLAGGGEHGHVLGLLHEVGGHAGFCPEHPLRRAVTALPPERVLGLGAARHHNPHLVGAGRRTGFYRAADDLL